MEQCPQIIKEIQVLNSELNNLQKQKIARNFLKIIIIGFFINKKIDKEIKALKLEINRRQTTLKKISDDHLESIQAKLTKINNQKSYLTKEEEEQWLTLVGLTKANLDYFQSQNLLIKTDYVSAINQVERIQQLIKTNNLKLDCYKAENDFNLLLNSDLYFSKKELHAWKTKWQQPIHLIENYVTNENTPSDFRIIANRIKSLQHSDELVQKRNKEFIAKEEEKFKQLFDRIESYPLTDEQKKAIITDEQNNLVIAGAGSGKTSTIIGKVAYLINKGLANPNEICLIAFNRDVKEEMEKRVTSKLGLSVTVRTYHSLGQEIIAIANKEKPSLSKLATDELKLKQEILCIIKNRMNDKEFEEMVNDYFLYLMTPYKSTFDFVSYGQYIRYIRQFDLRSLKGDRVKSLEECIIANFLYTKGIDYLYEAPYEIKTVDTNHRQYHPDFYLPKFKIYVEHFAINQFGKPAPYISEKEYLDSMEWKKAIHMTNKTRLIETYSYEQREGILLTNLERKLKDSGITFNPLPADEIFDELNKLGKVDQFSELISNFLCLFKSSGKSLNQIDAVLNKNDVRAKTFLKIFSKIYDDYNSYLRNNQEIDFIDMVNDAITIIKEGEYLSNFKYILVDEFQDISNNRYLFLKALADQNGSKLFCVGDDWQSIYRFTGSDISIMSDFQNKFEFSEITLLQETFRFNNKLCDFSTQFILKNPKQIKKQIISKKTIEASAVCVIRGNTREILEQLLKEMEMKAEKPQTVFVVGRYNKLEQEHLKDIPTKMEKLTIEFTTVRRSKGLQADYVIIVGLNGGKFGFPCQIIDDPLLNLVLSKEDEYPNAEERRLFYVAITRAKQKVYLIDDPKYNVSSFIIEIQNGGYEIESIGQLPKTAYCPICKTGEITQRKTEHRMFYSCSNYPYCDYTPKMCTDCREGYLYTKGAILKCSNEACDFKAEICPMCGTGYLKTRRNRRGAYFLGCSNYPRCHYSKRQTIGYIQ